MKGVSVKLVTALFCMALVLPLMLQCSDGICPPCGYNICPPRDDGNQTIDPERAVDIVLEAADLDVSEVRFDGYLRVPTAIYNRGTEKWIGNISLNALAIDHEVASEWQYRESSGMASPSYDPPPSGDVTVFEITYTIISEGESMSVTTSAHELFTDIYENDYFAYSHESSAITTNDVEGEDKYILSLQISGLKYDSRECEDYPCEGIVDGCVAIEDMGSAEVTIDYDYLDDCERAFVKVVVGLWDYCYDYDLVEGDLTETFCGER